jgi:hypothetical protein
VNLKEKFTQISNELKQEAAEHRYDLNESRDQLSEFIGFEDQVRGFDLENTTDENLDFLDIYAEFLGEEYFRMKDSYQKAITTMNELFMLENERARNDRAEKKYAESSDDDDDERIKIHTEPIDLSGFDVLDMDGNVSNSNTSVSNEDVLTLDIEELL